jgi:hypothetical protein
LARRNWRSGACSRRPSVTGRRARASHHSDSTRLCSARSRHAAASFRPAVAPKSRPSDSWRRALPSTTRQEPPPRKAHHCAQKGGVTRGWDRVAVSTAFKITMIEGIEVVFIVVAVRAGGHGLLLPACLGALAALVLVVALGVMLHRPVVMIPENTLKFCSGSCCAHSARSGWARASP